MIPLANKDWVLIPYDEILPRVLNFGLLLTILCTLNLCLYATFYIFFQLYVPDFKQLEKAKILYTLKNLSKSLVLSVLVFTTLPDIFRVIFYDIWINEKMFFWGTVYVSVDLLGLLVVPNLSKDTKRHHTVVCILGFVSAISDYRVRGLHQALLALTYLSAVPYIVNTYLGLRHLNNRKLKDGLITACFYIYTLSILLNFWAQHMYVFFLIPGGTSVAKLCYLLAYYLILKDDIHLLEYFRYKVKDPNLTVSKVNQDDAGSGEKDETKEKETNKTKNLVEDQKTIRTDKGISDGFIQVNLETNECMNEKPESSEVKETKSRFNWHYFMQLISKHFTDYTNSHH